MHDLDEIIEDKRNEGVTTLRQAQLVMLRLLRITDAICKKYGLNYWLCSGTLLGAVRHGGFIPWDDDIDVAMSREDYERFIEIAKNELPASVVMQLRGQAAYLRYNHNPCKLRDRNSRIVETGETEANPEKGLFIDIFPFDAFSKKGSLRYFYERIVKHSFIIMGKLKDSLAYKEFSLMRKIYSKFHVLWLFLFRVSLRWAEAEIRISRKKQTSRPYIGFGFDVPFKANYPRDVVFPLKSIEFEGYMFSCPNNISMFLSASFGSDYMIPIPEHLRKVHALEIFPDLRKCSEKHSELAHVDEDSLVYGLDSK